MQLTLQRFGFKNCSLKLDLPGFKIGIRPAKLKLELGLPGFKNLAGLFKYDQT